jgi:hypothetical protein
LSKIKFRLEISKVSPEFPAAFMPYDSARLICGDNLNFAVASPRRTWMRIGSNRNILAIIARMPEHPRKKIKSNKSGIRELFGCLFGYKACSCPAIQHNRDCIQALAATLNLSHITKFSQASAVWPPVKNKVLRS